MGYPTQGQIAKACAEITVIVKECEREIDRVKQLVVHHGELLRSIQKQLEKKNGI
jgi:hypothetical protein